MKNIYFFLLACIVTLNSIAQAPSSFKYQAVLRDNEGNLISNNNVKLRVSLIRDSINGENAFIEAHNVQSNAFGMVNLNIGRGSAELNNFASIDWSTGTYFIKIEVDITGGSAFIQAGDPVQLLSVPFAMYADKTNTHGKFQITGNNQQSADSALFEVRDRNGNVVFAVYEDGAELIVSKDTKGARGGFTVGGRSGAKGSIVDDIMRISPDSVRFYIDNSIDKGSKGGFTVGGRTTTKGIHPQYLRVTQDSSRIYTTDTIAGFGVGTLNGLQTASYMHLNPQNYFIGQNSGERIFTGKTEGDTAKYNCTLGYQTGMFLTRGMRNVFIGYQAGYLNTVGSYNTGIGNIALTSNINGRNNCAIGESSLYANISGINNVAIGIGAMEYNTTGNYNAALGSFALAYCKRGIGNVAIGNNAMLYDTASFNTAVGAVALRSNTSGVSQTAIGNSACYLNTTGSYLTAIGNNALASNIDGNENTAAGQQAMYYNISGSQNTAVGRGTLANNTYGNGNSALGYAADVASGSLSNATAIGYGAIVNASNKVIIGNSNVTSIGGYAAFTNYSDRRLKQNIFYNESLGLNFISKLHTVSFNYSADTGKHRHDGLIAQEVQQTLEELGLEFSGLIIDTDSAKTLNLSYSEFVVPLINAVKELSRQNEELLKKSDEERMKNLKLENDIKEIKEFLQGKEMVDK